MRFGELLPPDMVDIKDLILGHLWNQLVPTIYHNLDDKSFIGDR